MYRVQSKIYAEIYTSGAYVSHAEADALAKGLHGMGIPAEVQVLLEDRGQHGEDLWVRVGR